MTEPLVSICIPTRNRADELAARLAELSGQSWRNHEVVIVDDGSTDHTGEIVLSAAAADRRIRYVPLDSAAGMPGVIDRCLQEARGDLVAFFHDHDSYTRQAVERLARALLDVPEAGFSFCGIETVDPSSGDHMATYVEPPGFGRPRDVVRRFVRNGACPVAGSCVMVRRSRLPDVAFAPELGAFADVGLWCELSAAGPTPYVAEPLATVQAWTEQDSVGKLSWAVLGELAQLRRKYVPLVGGAPRQQRRQRLLIVLETARARGLFLLRVISLGLRARPIPDSSAARAPSAVAALVATAQFVASRRTFRTSSSL